MKKATLNLQYFLPSNVELLSFDSVSPALSKYKLFYDEIDEYVVESEIERWKITVQQHNLKEKSLSDLLKKMSADTIFQLSYPTVLKSLKLLATLPVTTATAERSFSTMNRILTDLRISMNVDRLSALALLSSHSNLAQAIDLDKVIDLFAEKCDRRMPLR